MTVKKRRGTPGKALVELDFTETRTESDFPFQARSPWRRQFAAVLEAWHRGSVNGGIDDGEFVRVARFDTPHSAGRYISRFARQGNGIVPPVTDPTGETFDGDSTWMFKATVVENDDGTPGSELWVAIVPADGDYSDDDDGDNMGGGDDD